MPNDEEKPLIVEGPATREDWEKAQQMDPADVARLLAMQRMTGEVGAQALATVEAKRIDGLSGLLEKDTFAEESDKVVERMNSPHRRRNDPDGAFIFMFDIRDMHELNNTSGQVAGDKAIEVVGQLLKSTFRMEEGDVVGRTGGDEFTVIAPYYLNEMSGENPLTPEEIGRIIKDRLVANWLTLEEQDISSDFELLGHFVPVELGKTRQELREEADPKTHRSEALLFSRQVRPLAEAEEPLNA
jgi:GGDEF domain-containing protein